MAKEHRYFVYTLASQRNGTLYVGVTNDLTLRTAQHRDNPDWRLFPDIAG